MAKKRYKKKETLSDAVKLIVMGLLMGAVFTYNVRFLNATVIRDECTMTEIVFADYECYGSKGYVRKIAVYGSDGERYFIDGSVADREVVDVLSEIPLNKGIRLLLHPNSDSIMEIVSQDEIILNFEDSMRELEKEASFFSGLGNFMYAGALFGGGWLVYELHQRNKFECEDGQSKKGQRKT